MACQHLLTNSTTYPVGTRCGRCGKSAESILADVQLQLTDTESRLKEALARVSALDEEKAETARLRGEVESLDDRLQGVVAEALELRKDLTRSLVQTESLSKENIRLSGELRQAVEREKALQRKLEEFETAEAQNPASITQHSRRVEVPERRR